MVRAVSVGKVQAVYEDTYSLVAEAVATSAAAMNAGSSMTLRLVTNFIRKNWVGNGSVMVRIYPSNSDNPRTKPAV